ncbi:MAG: T9SS type A sorting domain-containing protein [Bacteroidetes bacterium]|nr:T9SS type A sorting domain-containing protein [Bacteroidota bacterium]
MKTFFILFFSFSLALSSFARPKENFFSNPYSVVKAQVTTNANNIASKVWNTGVFDQDLSVSNTPGFEWPKGAGKFAIFTAGLSTGAYVNGGLRLASVSYNGEYAPGYVLNGVFTTNSSFKLYKVSRGDNAGNNPDYANWGLMVPYGAPFDDVNGNGVYDAGVDKPGVKSAAQTVFVCLTDADSTSHSASEGFSGGTSPLKAEMRLTVWSYDNVASLNDVQFLKMQIINKNSSAWDSTYFGLVTDPDLGDASDDFIGCDITRNLGYCYNADNTDGTGSGTSYGANPPAVGFRMLKSAKLSGGSELGITSLNYFTNSGSGGPTCEQDPSGAPVNAYNYLKGLKRDGTPFLNAALTPPQITKFCFTGDPETGTGWTEYTGIIKNCGGATTGTVEASSPGDRRLIIASGAGNLKVNPLDTQTFVVAQLIARGSNNKNSVTKLKQMCDTVQAAYAGNFVIGVNNISTDVPEKYSLHQNYPNPFNPSTKIMFDINKSGFVSLTVFDITGKEVTKLVSQNLAAGTYDYDFNAAGLPSGIYFYKLETAGYSEVKKMTLIK